MGCQSDPCVQPSSSPPVGRLRLRFRGNIGMKGASILSQLGPALNGIDGAPQHDSTTAGDRTLNEPIWLILHLFMGKSVSVSQAQPDDHMDMTNGIFSSFISILFYSTFVHPFPMAHLVSIVYAMTHSDRVGGWWGDWGGLLRAETPLCWCFVYFPAFAQTFISIKCKQRMAFRYKLDISFFQFHPYGVRALSSMFDISRPPGTLT